MLNIPKLKRLMKTTLRLRVKCSNLNSVKAYNECLALCKSLKEQAINLGYPALKENIEAVEQDSFQAVTAIIYRCIPYFLEEDVDKELYEYFKKKVPKQLPEHMYATYLLSDVDFRYASTLLEASPSQEYVSVFHPLEIATYNVTMSAMTVHDVESEKYITTLKIPKEIKRELTHQEVDRLRFKLSCLNLILSADDRLVAQINCITDNLLVCNNISTNSRDSLSFMCDDLELENFINNPLSWINKNILSEDWFLPIDSLIPCEIKQECHWFMWTHEAFSLGIDLLTLERSLNLPTRYYVFMYAYQRYKISVVLKRTIGNNLTDSDFTFVDEILKTERK